MVCLRSVSLTMRAPEGHFCFNSTAPAGGLKPAIEPAIEDPAWVEASMWCLSLGQLSNPYSRATINCASASESFDPRMSSSLNQVAGLLGISLGRVYLAKHRVSVLVKQELRKLERMSERPLGQKL